ncbi:hypothetical protein GCM10009839_56660 [Catenulispora yoronensis]|uniref:Uncharacterized protein n=1 Tax=Catenulispora yoronensis TaxID=450799 RepID=A0ABN2UYG8_9ACTN
MDRTEDAAELIGRNTSTWGRGGRGRGAGTTGDAICSAVDGSPLPLSAIFVTGLAPEGQIVVTRYAILRIPAPPYETAPVAVTGAVRLSFLRLAA